MIVTIGIREGVKREITVETGIRNKTKDGERNAVVMKEMKVKMRTNICLKGNITDIVNINS